MARVVVVVALAAAGCAVAHRVHSAEDVSDAGRVGLVVLGVESPHRVTLELCRDGDVLRCVRVGPVLPTGSLVVYAIPPGRYCVDEVTIDNGVCGVSIHARQPECMDIEPGVLTYPGHLVLAGDGPRGWVRRGTARAEFEREYPRLNGLRVALVDPVPTPRPY